MAYDNLFTIFKSISYNSYPYETALSTIVLCDYIYEPPLNTGTQRTGPYYYTKTFYFVERIIWNLFSYFWPEYDTNHPRNSQHRMVPAI